MPTPHEPPCDCDPCTLNFTGADAWDLALENQEAMTRRKKFLTYILRYIKEIAREGRFVVSLPSWGLSKDVQESFFRPGDIVSSDLLWLIYELGSLGFHVSTDDCVHVQIGKEPEFILKIGFGPGIADLNNPENPFYLHPNRHGKHNA